MAGRECGAVAGLGGGAGSRVRPAWRIMSAEAVGAQMPTQVTLGDLALMAGADERHRYELSCEGVLSVVPPAGPVSMRCWCPGSSCGW